MSDERIQRYREARLACEAAKTILEEYDFAELINAIGHADSVGPILDPTLWMQKSTAMHEDQKVFAAALRFLGTWQKREPRSERSADE